MKREVGGRRQKAGGRRQEPQEAKKKIRTAQRARDCTLRGVRTKNASYLSDSHR